MWLNVVCTVTLQRHIHLVCRCAHVLLISVILSSSGGDARGNDFADVMKPLLNQFCVDCHNADHAEVGLRLDELDGTLPQRRLRLWQTMRAQIKTTSMPPEDAPQPTGNERKLLLEWIDAALVEARSRPDEYNGSSRRLTVSQYRNILRDLLGIEEEVTEGLPPDAVSREGFSNNTEAMVLTPLQVESFVNVAERALDVCLVDAEDKPHIQHVRMDLGEGINPAPFPESLILGANSALLSNADFVVTQPALEKPFRFEQVRMRTKYRFNEGYAGNSTVRGWRDYDSIYHAVFACVRGPGGYPQGRAWETVPGGLLLRPAIPGRGLFGVDSTYGHQANFKVSLRELPTHGNFRITVEAAKYDDGLLLTEDDPPRDETLNASVVVSNTKGTVSVSLPAAGIYQIDAWLKDEETKDAWIDLTVGARQFSGNVTTPSFLALRLPAGEQTFNSQLSHGKLDRLVLTRLAAADPVTEKFTRFEQRFPWLGAHIGLRRDCGTTFSRVEKPLPVSSTERRQYEFFGAIRNFPGAVEVQGNDNYLAGLRDVGIRSEYLDGRATPRLLLRSVQIEGPYYESWPPQTHQRIMIPSDDPPQSPQYARRVILNFAERAFRRPVRVDEARQLLQLWRQFFDDSGNFQESVKSTLIVILTSPQFLFMTARSESPGPEQLDGYELASRLSSFLWNSGPDDELLQLAGDERLHEMLDEQLSRMIADSRFERFTNQFVREWLDLQRFDVVDVDFRKFPRMTPHSRAALREEPIQYVQHLIRENVSLRNLVRSDFVVANEATAEFYGISPGPDSGPEFVAVTHETRGLGGVLTQAAVLSGLSDGREANPVKRGAWLARKIIAEPPPDPPPGVPDLPEDHGDLTLRERLELHRNHEGCKGCHARIDPWGIPFQQYNAGGLLHPAAVAANALLPDGTQVSGVQDLQQHLAADRMNQVTFSFLKHLATYAIGRSLTYNETELLRKKAPEFESTNYATQDIVRFLVSSPMFLAK